MEGLDVLEKINLQMFADEFADEFDGETAEENQEIEQEITDEIETEPDEITEEIEVEDTGEEEPAEEEKPSAQEKPTDTVPLAKYVAERKKRQEYEKILAQQEAEREKAKLVEELVNRGWPEYEAELQAAEKIRQSREAKEIKDRLLDFEIKELARNDPFFADAVAYAAAIKEKMQQWDCDAETAYMAIRGKARTKEMQLQKEQLALAQRRSSPAKKVENAAPEKPRSPYKLDEADKKALAELRKAQPEANWTIEKYWKMMKE
jgi:hypothetical protein